MLFDFGATNSFISFDCVKSLDLSVSSLPYKVIVSRLFYDGQQQDFLYEFDLFASFLS